jgi:hypothetical protein
MRFYMIFEQEIASATAVKPGVAMLVQDTAGIALPVLGREGALRGWPEGQRAQRFSGRDALW